MANFSPEYLSICREAMGSEQTRSLVETNNWSHVDRPTIHADWDRLYRTLAPLIDNFEPSSASVQELIGEHYSIASRFYVPSCDAYIGLSLFYKENEDMAKFHNGYHPKMVDFLHEAIGFYAVKSLK
jgi:TipAS antibiotic-recognition domain